MFLVGAVTWLGLLFTDISVLLSTKNEINSDIPLWVPGILLNLFILSVYYYYKLKIEREDVLNFVDLLWRIFASGLVVTIISLALRLIEFLLNDTNLLNHPVFIDFNYLVNLGLLVTFIILAFTVYKRLILYQKSKWLLRLWTFFEAMLVFSILYSSFNLPIVQWVYYTMLSIIIVVGIILTGNMKWVAYLNFRQKWTSLLLLALTIFYLVYLLFTSSSLAESLGKDIISDFRIHVFMLALIVFVSVYSAFSFLVILFNLPTTSVFEQKLEEVVNFQRISQSIQTEQSEESVYRILLETSVSTVFADAAWLEIQTAPGNRVFTYKITEREAREITNHLKESHVKGVLDQGSDKTRNLSKHLSSLKSSRFRSILAYPIFVKGQNFGTLALVKELPDGFNKEMTKIVSTFANQASISIENFRLMEEALHNERYKEELKIAKNVQRSLLPAVLEKDDAFEIAAFSESADEVGGDYYDTARISDHQVALIIADVSGKGTTAAFHMSQMKGIFHSLSQEALEPDEFMIRANFALKHCLERGSFISATYFLIDTARRTVKYARAGHCPLLYYHYSTQQAEYLKDKGIALGMVRNNSYRNFIEAYEFSYCPGDVMVLYTDGITEAKNSKGEEFGLDRLAEVIREANQQNPFEMKESMINKLYEFTGTADLNDDYTTMILRFTLPGNL